MSRKRQTGKKNCPPARGLQSIVPSKKKHVWEWEVRASARWMTRLGLGNGTMREKKNFAKEAKILRQS